MAAPVARAFGTVIFFAVFLLYCGHFVRRWYVFGTVTFFCAGPSEWMNRCLPAAWGADY
jgi:hypothetical protein